MTEPKLGWWRDGFGDVWWHAAVLPESASDINHRYIISTKRKANGKATLLISVVRNWFAISTYLGDGPEPVDVGEEEEDDDSLDERMGALEALVRNLMASTTTNSSRLTKRVDIVEHSFHTLDALVNKIEKLLIAANIDERLNEMNIRLARDQAQRAAGAIEFAKRVESVEAAIRSHDSRLCGVGMRISALEGVQEFVVHGDQFEKLAVRVDVLEAAAEPESEMDSGRRHPNPGSEPEPFRITSLGLYQRRDGGAEPIVKHDSDGKFQWLNAAGAAWQDNGGYWNGGPDPMDLVARIGDLPEVANG